MNPRKNTMALAARFSAAAGTYHQAAAVQEKVAESLSRLFPDLPLPQSRSLRTGAQAGLAPPARILEIGCGTGLLTELIRRRYPEFRIDVADISARMIAQARARLRFDERICWRVADLRRVPVATPYPLIVSSSSLHWISPLAEGLSRIAALLAEGGYAVFSLMLRGTLGELRKCRLDVAPHKPPAGNLPTCRQVRLGLRHAGLTIMEERKEIRRIEYPSAEAFLRHIHDQGLTGGAVSTSHLPLNRKELQALLKAYQASYAAAAGVTASYHVAYFMARKDGQ